jgi:hypothetical protein
VPRTRERADLHLGDQEERDERWDRDVRGQIGQRGIQAKRNAKSEHDPEVDAVQRRRAHGEANAD